MLMVFCCAGTISHMKKNIGRIGFRILSAMFFRAVSGRKIGGDQRIRKVQSMRPFNETGRNPGKLSQLSIGR